MIHIQSKIKGETVPLVICQSILKKKGFEKRTFTILGIFYPIKVVINFFRNWDNAFFYTKKSEDFKDIKEYTSIVKITENGMVKLDDMPENVGLLIESTK